jgi:hypothetical protein
VGLEPTTPGLDVVLTAFATSAPERNRTSSRRFRKAPLNPLSYEGLLLGPAPCGAGRMAPQWLDVVRSRHSPFPEPFGEGSDKGGADSLPSMG